MFSLQAVQGTSDLMPAKRFIGPASPRTRQLLANFYRRYTINATGIDARLSAMRRRMRSALAGNGSKTCTPVEIALINALGIAGAGQKDAAC